MSDTSPRGGAPEHSDEDAATNARLWAAWQASKAVPESEREPVANPDKYAAPVGLDDEGRPHSDEVLRRATRRRDRA